MLYTTNKEERWKIFDGYARRLITQDNAYAFNREEWTDFLYLKIYFAEDYLQKKLKPWLPSLFDKGPLNERTSK